MGKETRVTLASSNFFAEILGRNNVKILGAVAHLCTTGTHSHVPSEFFQVPEAVHRNGAYMGRAQNFSKS